jgi:diketogulonate reductase-like aldo/keto reductase
MLLLRSVYLPSRYFASSVSSQLPAVRTMASTSSNSKAQPSFIYGTAWKKTRTKRLVKEAIVAGFRRVDTAAQLRHYQEHLVGEALRELYSSGITTRSDIYVREEK